MPRRVQQSALPATPGEPTILMGWVSGELVYISYDGVRYVQEGTVPELMGSTEVAEALGTTTANLAKFVNLPEPAVDYLSRGKLYRAKEIHELARQRAERRASHG